jgi:tocopherol O-methyltransferase
MTTSKEILEYYADSKWDYRLYNKSLTDLSMHYGLWDENTRNHKDALRNENRVVCSAAQIKSTDSVIDLGCGYGSTAIWLASNIGCRVLGVSLSKDQIFAAQRLARKRRVEHHVSFETMDFHCMKLPDSAFDVAILMEAISHSPEKLRVLKEVYRILKPGGRVVIADGFLGKRRAKLTAIESQIAAACFEGVHIPPLPVRRDFRATLKSAGFTQIHWWDKTLQILPTAMRVHRLGQDSSPSFKTTGEPWHSRI